MNVGELFINLGIKGSDKTVKALSDVKMGLGEAKSMSLEAKAGILGAMYALEQLFAASGAMGTGLTNMTTLLGMSAKTLQQYDYAARQVGLTNQEMESTFVSLQSKMTQASLGKGVPEGMALMAQKTRQTLAQDLVKFGDNPDQLLQRLQEYATNEKNTKLANEVLKSFGLSGGMISGLRRRAFTPEILARAPTYSEGELRALDRANIAWSNLATKIEMAIGHFNALHGGQLVNDISKVTDSVLKLVGALAKLADSVKLFSIIGKIFQGWTGIINAAGDVAKKPSIVGDVAKEAPSVLKAMLDDISLSPETKEKLKDILYRGGNPNFPIAPNLPNLPQNGASKTNNATINQTFHGPAEPKKVEDAAKKGVHTAFFQMPTNLEIG